MGAGGGLVAGSGKEFVVINAEDSWRAKPLRELGGGICQICGEHIEILEFNNIKEFFVACNECAFPVCRHCYEYERREGDQLCPRCKTRYKRQRGSPRVDGDDEEDEADDLDHEFSFCNANWNIVSGSKFGIHGNIGPCSSELYHSNSKISTDFPRLTYGEAHAHDHHTLIVPLSMKSRDSTDKAVFPAELCTPFQARPMNQSGGISLYGYGSIAWKNRVENWNRRRLKFEEEDKDFDECDADALIRDEARQPLSRKLPIASKKINPYRLVIILRLIAIAFFFHYRLLNPVPNAYALWLASVICEASFAISWMLEQLPKWQPIERETFLDRLSLRYEKEEEERSQLADVDVFINTVDPKKEHPLATANAVLSVLAVDYPADKVSCYVSDDGAAMLTFEALSETAVYAKRWVPFCKRFNIEPRAPEWYFYQKMEYLKGKIDPAFVGERRAMKREYEEFKVRINGLVSMSQKVPEEGWTMQHGAPWPGNNAQDHPGMVQVFLGHGDSLDENGDNLPRLVYVSREKRPGFNHHKRAGAMNALMRVSGVLSNAPFILNLDCRHYINNSKVLREAMCFMMDPTSGRKVCFVQFPYKIDGDNRIDNFSDRVVFFNINMKGLDGIQGPIYLGTGCVFRRQALYGIEAPMKEKHTSNTRNCWRKWCFLCNLGRRSRTTRPKNEENNKFLKQNGEISTQVHSLETILEEVAGKDVELLSLAPFDKLEKKFGRSPAVVASTLTENSRISIAKRSASALEEALHVISCGYEDKTAWGKEVGWIYGSVADDVLTSFKMHCHGWRSVYCMPRRIAFKGAAPTDISDYLRLVLRWAQGSVEIFLSKHCPIWYGYGSGMKCLQRLSYISLIICPWTALPFITYCILPAFCLLTGKFFIAEVTIYLSIILLALFTSIIATSILEMNWGELALADWWQNERFWAISAASSYLFALFHGAVEIFTGIKAELFLAHTGQQNEERRRRKWPILLIPPTALVMLNTIGLVSGISNAVNGNYDSWAPLFGKLLFAVWVVVLLCPSLKGMRRERKRWVPTIVLVWSILVASVCSLLWVRLDPFVSQSEGPVLEVCGLDCD